MTTITGYVNDQYGRPVVGASVYVLSAPVRMPDIAQLTDEQGKFILGAPTPGRYTIGIRSDTLGSVETNVDVKDDPVSVQVKFN